MYLQSESLITHFVLGTKASDDFEDSGRDLLQSVDSGLI